MKLAIRLLQGGFDPGDVVVVVPDTHEFSSLELTNNDEALIVDVSDNDKNLLTLSDSRFKNTAAMTNIPTLKAYTFKAKNLRIIRKRKYNLNQLNEPEIKL